MPTLKPTASELLELLVCKAKALRDVGVLRVELDGCKFDLAPGDGPPEERRVPSEEVPIVDDADPFADRATYGGGPVPGFRRRIRDDDGN